MNFVGHMVVAERAAGGASTAHLLGAAAPDLARMAGLPVAPEGPSDFRAGVAEHHRADGVFHELAWFRRQNRSLVTELTDRGVRRGPARGAAHVLIELLLDGALLTRDEHVVTFDRAWSAMARADEAALAMVPPDGHDRWVDFLDQVTSRLEPAAYGDAAYAADRTAGTLNRRRRLAMDPAEQAVLRSVAAEVQPVVVDAAADVVRSVAASAGT